MQKKKKKGRKNTANKTKAEEKSKGTKATPGKKKAKVKSEEAKPAIKESKKEE